MLTVPIQRLRPSAKLPSSGSPQAAGYDLYACLEEESLTIPPHGTCKVPTGIALAIPEGYFGAVFARSGLAVKHGVTLSNCVGVIDSDYRGEIKVGLVNQGTQDYTIQPGERIAQLVVMPVCTFPVEECESLDETGRGEGGFGSTGKN